MRLKQWVYLYIYMNRGPVPACAGLSHHLSYPLFRLLIYPCPHSADSALCRENVICGSIDLV